jgi:hypothetical protein
MDRTAIYRKARTSTACSRRGTSRRSRGRTVSPRGGGSPPGAAAPAERRAVGALRARKLDEGAARHYRRIAEAILYE